MNPVRLPSKYEIEVATKVFKFIFDEFGVTISELQGNSQKKEISNARWFANHLLFKYTNMSCHCISEIFRKHPSFASVAKRLFQSRLDYNSEFAAKTNPIIEKFENQTFQTA